MARFSILVSLLKKLFKFLCPLNDSHNRFNGPKEPREPIYTLEAFNRWNKTNKFLKVEWLEKKKAFKLLFTGFKEDPNTSKVSEHLTFTVDLQGTIFFAKNARCWLNHWLLFYLHSVFQKKNHFKKLKHTLVILKNVFLKCKSIVR